ncbi:MAG TPA: hypothetical protein VFK30_05465, partial [Anaerolineae bacterium]|nr:hypothetical protein [Anaerolineae bacterium]
LLQDRPLQQAMRAAGLHAARPHAAEEVAEYVLRDACDVNAKLVLPSAQYGSSQEFIRVENTPLSIH